MARWQPASCRCRTPSLRKRRIHMPLESERFIKSYSSLIESPIWPDDGLFKLYHYCLYKASRNVYLWRGIQIQPGEFPAMHRSKIRLTISAASSSTIHFFLSAGSFIYP